MPRRRRSSTKATTRLWTTLGKQATRSATKTMGKVQRAMTRVVTDAVVRAVKDQQSAVGEATRRVLTGVSTPAPAPARQAGGRWEEGAWGGPLAHRRYRVFIPKGVSKSRPATLLVLLHGCGQDAAAFAACTHAAARATAQRCIVLMPEQSAQANPQRCWNWFRATARVAAEAALLMAMIDHVVRQHPVLPGHVDVLGLSAGGAMAMTLALHYPDRFHAVAAHSASPPHSATNAPQAARVMHSGTGGQGAAGMLVLRGYLAGRIPPPLLLIHGDADHIVHFDNATHAAALWLSLSGHDGLAPRAPRSVQRGNRRGQRVFDWVVDGEPYIRLVRVQGLAHAWSGGAASQAFSDPTGPDALRMAFAFFDRVGSG